VFASRHAHSPQSPVPPAPSPSAPPLRTVVNPAIPVSPLAALTAGWTGVWQATRWRPRCLRVAAPFLLFATMLGGRGRRLCWPLIPVPRRVVESFSLVLWWFLVLAAGFLTICSPNWRTRAGGCWLAHPPRSRRRPHGDRLGQSACNARGIHLASKHNNRVRARPAIQPRWAARALLVSEGRCDNPPSAPAIVLTHVHSDTLKSHRAGGIKLRRGCPSVARRVWKSIREKETSNKHLPADRSRCDARTALARWPFAATQGRGVVSRQNQEQLPRLQGLTGAICCGAVALYQLRTFSRLEQKLVVVSARCRGLHAVIIEMACSCIDTDTDSSIEFPGVSQRKVHDPSCAILFASIISAATDEGFLPHPYSFLGRNHFFFVCTNFIRCHQNK